MAARSFLSISTLDCSPTPAAMTQTRRSGTWSCSSSSSSPPVLGDAQGYWRQQEDELSLAHSGWSMQTQAFPVNSLILSAQFWPQFKAECLEFPHEVSEALDVNTKAFQTLKGNRTLVCKSHLGFANIDIEIGDKKIKCLPFLQPSSTRSWRLLSGQPKGWPPASRCRSPPCAGRSPSGSRRGCWWRTHQTPSVWWRRVA